MANGGINQEVKELLREKGIIIIDDWKCNAGGVIASYCEWRQNLGNQKYTKEDVFKYIEDKMNSKE